MQPCPYCSNSLMRHVHHGKLEWFCRHCWIVLPMDLNKTDKIRDLHTLSVQERLAS